MPTDEQGRFEFRAASLRVYVVTVTHPDYCPAILPPYDDRERIPRQRRFLNLLNETDSQMSAAAQEMWLEWMHNDLMAVPHVDVLLMRRPCALGE